MVSSMQTAHYYRQRLDGGELYFLALDPLKNGGWRGLLVRHYARPEKAVNTTVPKSFFNLWEHVTSVPPAVDKRFGDAGNLGTMRNRRKRGAPEKWRIGGNTFVFEDGWLIVLNPGVKSLEPYAGGYTYMPVSKAHKFDSYTAAYAYSQKWSKTRQAKSWMRNGKRRNQHHAAGGSTLTQQKTVSRNRGKRRNGVIEFYFKDGRGKTSGYSKAALEDTVFESELWDRPSVRKRVAALRPGKSITIGKEKLTRADIEPERNGLREVGRKISAGAKKLYGRAKKAIQDERDDEHVAKVREYALDAGAQYNARNLGAAEHALMKAHLELDKIADSDKRERAAKMLTKLEGLLGVYRNRASRRNGPQYGGGHSGGLGMRARNSARRGASIHDDKFWGGTR